VTEPNVVLMLESRLRKRFAGLRVAVDPPAESTGTWWIDLRLGAHHTALSWQSGRGFGIYLEDLDAYGAAPELLTEDLDEAIAAVAKVLQFWLSTSSEVDMRRSNKQPLPSSR